ncbi:MAG: DUF1295 domain-containing protein [Blastocatellia bacterium]
MNLLLLTLSIIICAMVLLWLVSLRLRDASIVDIFWGAGFAGVALIAIGHQVQFRLAEVLPTRQLLVGGMTIVWGLRLALYLGWRNLGRGEDPRYQAMRKRYADRFPLFSLPLVFLLQGVLIWLISLPVQLAGRTAPGFGAGDWIGAGLWLVGLLFESTGDWQLAKFKADPANKGRVLDRGLWAWTRHPNYFGDALVWWGLSLPVIMGGLPWVIVSPLVMTWLLMRVSGVPLLEKGLIVTRPGYADYIERTSQFFPRPPRRGIRG